MKYVLLVYVGGSRKVPENNAKLTDNWVNEMDRRGIRLIGSQLRPVAETTADTILDASRRSGWRGSWSPYRPTSLLSVE